MNVYVNYLFAFCITFGIISCKKENKPNEEESQGTTFNFLQKTILRSPDNSAEKITLYEYNSVGLVAKAIYFDKTNGISSTIKNTETFYRSSSRLDSVVFVTTDTTVIKYKAVVVFTYDFTNKISKSVYIGTPGLSAGSQMVRDSSLYLYNSGQLSQRTDYRSHDNNPYTLLRELYYSYDVAGNLSMLRLVWPTIPSTDTVKFTFDNKTNSIPVERGTHFWAPAFYDDYKFINNPISKTVRNSDSYIYEYRYTTNNKPLYRKEKVIGSPSYGELYYYYD
jgi:hypothetical protein